MLKFFILFFSFLLLILHFQQLSIMSVNIGGSSFKRQHYKIQWFMQRQDFTKREKAWRSMETQNAIFWTIHFHCPLSAWDSILFKLNFYEMVNYHVSFSIQGFYIFFMFSFGCSICRLVFEVHWTLNCWITPSLVHIQGCLKKYAIEAILSAQIDDPLAWKQAHLPIGKAGLAIGIVDDHPDAAYISSRLGTAGLVNKLLGRNDADADLTDDLSAEFERLRQCVNPGDLDALDKILKFIPEALVAVI